MSTNKDRTTANQTVKKEYSPCKACDGLLHIFKRYYFVLGREKEWIIKKAQKTFRNNMQISSFKEEVDNIRSENINK